MGRINTHEIVIFNNRNNIHKIKLESIWDLNINKSICEQFANFSLIENYLLNTVRDNLQMC